MQGSFLAAGQIYGVGTMDSSILIFLGFLVFSPFLSVFFFGGSIIGSVLGECAANVLCVLLGKYENYGNIISFAFIKSLSISSSSFSFITYHLSLPPSYQILYRPHAHLSVCLPGVLMTSPPYLDVYTGLWGYNAMLTAGGISYFLHITPSSILAACVGALIAALTQAASIHVFSVVMTGGYVLAFIIIITTSLHCFPLRG